MRLVISAYVAGGVILLSCCYLAPHLEHALPRAQPEQQVFTRDEYATEDVAPWAWRWHPSKGGGS